MANLKEDKNFSLMYIPADLFTIASANVLLPVQHQAITWTYPDLWKIGPYGTNFSDIWIKI